VPDGTGRPSPAWLRPVRKRCSPSPSASRVSSASPAAQTFIGQDIMSAQPELLAGPAQIQAQVPADLEALFNTNDYVDLSALDTAVNNTPNMGSGQLPSTGFTPRAASSRGMTNAELNFDNFAEGGQGQYIDQNQGGQTMMGEYMNDNLNGSGSGGGNTMTFDFGQNGVGFGGEMLAGEGMDTVSDGLRGGDQNQGL
jgi:hypothetical protein